MGLEPTTHFPFSMQRNQSSGSIHSLHRPLSVDRLTVQGNCSAGLEAAHYFPSLRRQGALAHLNYSPPTPDEKLSQQ